MKGLACSNVNLNAFDKMYQCPSPIRLFRMIDPFPVCNNVKVPPERCNDNTITLSPWAKAFLSRRSSRSCLCLSSAGRKFHQIMNLMYFLEEFCNFFPIRIDFSCGQFLRNVHEWTWRLLPGHAHVQWISIETFEIAIVCSKYFIKVQIPFVNSESLLQWADNKSGALFFDDRLDFDTVVGWLWRQFVGQGTSWLFLVRSAVDWVALSDCNMEVVPSRANHLVRSYLRAADAIKLSILHGVASTRCGKW